MQTRANQAETRDHGPCPGGCLVLVPPGQPEPTTLLSALAFRNIPARVVRDEPTVMMAFADRPLGRRILIVVEPGRWRRLAELICAVHAYHGEVLCWQLATNGDGRAKLARLDQHFSGPGPKPGSNGRPRAYDEGGDATNGSEHDTAPIGAIHRRRRPVDALITKIPGQPLSSREVVTQQELTMLLGPAPGEAG